jgi:hypothetical protein
LTKGDLGGFKNLQVERIYGKRYRWRRTGETPVPLKKLEGTQAMGRNPV